MTPLSRAKLVDAKSYMLERAAFHGRECWVSMKMGLVEKSYYDAISAFRFAVAGGYYREEN